ncbi:hypothetical protein AABB24_002990 [Solanum stoloniferum]|uniref:Hydroxyproline-rich glycoprotein family protein n=2 Tax=Solanum TaxID=4107 RepID=A0AAF0TG80_SOLVR|nr:uncharacterized protein At5g65660-like [Solanum verrucosum]WMV14843.1 hypothetical protein MTR67_008228 [Solanum verrucosum]
MESPQYYAPPQIVDSSSRPSLGFPLGTALLLLVVFSLSGVFSCCYHWDKIRTLRRRSLADIEAGDDDPSSLKPKHTNTSEKQNQCQSMPAVLMPGDVVPKFIAMPCPCQPPIPEKVVVEEQKPPQPPPPKPVRMVVGLPLY